jgi:hypothetical protein
MTADNTRESGQRLPADGPTTRALPSVRGSDGVTRLSVA